MSRSSRRLAMAGFTLLELAICVALLGLLSAYAMMKQVTPATMTLPTQAQNLAALIRRAQVLALERGQQMSVSVAASGANGTVAIACSNGAMPCSTDTSLTVDQRVVVGSAGTMYFNSLGQPVNSAGVAVTSGPAFTLSFVTGGVNSIHTVTVAPLTGRVSVSP